MFLSPFFFQVLAKYKICYISYYSIRSNLYFRNSTLVMVHIHIVLVMSVLYFEIFIANTIVFHFFQKKNSPNQTYNNSFCSVSIIHWWLNIAPMYHMHIGTVVYKFGETALQLFTPHSVFTYPLHSKMQSCTQRDLNPHPCYRTWTWTMRVCQFRHACKQHVI